MKVALVPTSSMCSSSNDNDSVISSERYRNGNTRLARLLLVERSCWENTTVSDTIRVPRDVRFG